MTSANVTSDVMQERWRYQYNLIRSLIPKRWLITVAPGIEMVDPMRYHEPLIRLHQSLSRMGMTMGWEVDDET